MEKTIHAQSEIEPEAGPSRVGDPTLPVSNILFGNNDGRYNVASTAENTTVPSERRVMFPIIPEIRERGSRLDQKSGSKLPDGYYEAKESCANIIRWMKKNDVPTTIYPPTSVMALESISEKFKDWKRNIRNGIKKKTNAHQ